MHWGADNTLYLNIDVVVGGEIKHKNKRILFAGSFLINRLKKLLLNMSKQQRKIKQPYMNILSKQNILKHLQLILITMIDGMLALDKDILHY